MIPVPSRARKPNIQRKSQRDWLKGVVSAYDDGRTPVDGLRAAGNVVLDQDGVVRPRPSMLLYGTQPTGTVLGEVFEFVKETATGSENYLITVQNVSGTAQVYTSKDGGAWTVRTGKTYNTTAPCHFVQADNKVLIMNGTDTLSYLNITTLAVVGFTALTTPLVPTIVRTGMVGTTYTYYYKVTANSSVGETAASPEASQQTLIPREAWDSTTNYLTISWTAVPSAVSYNLYIGTVSGTEYLLVAGINGLSFKDDGSTLKNVAINAPVGDSTQGPKVLRGSVINSQIFLYGDVTAPRTIYIGGTGDSVMDFSPFGGGGTLDIGSGTKEFPVAVKSFRDGRGQAQITVLCRGTNGSGKRYLVTPDSTTVGTEIVNFYSVTEDNGQDGTSSPDGVVLYKDSLWYPSNDGFKTTGTKPQLQNILSTSTVSETIITDIKNLNTASMDKCVGLAYQDRLYWALPVGASTNNEIWVLDLARQGAWMKPWSIPASWMVLYNDNSGLTHHLVLSANKIYELSYAQATNDNNVAFSTSAISGLNFFSDDTLEWAKVIDVTFIVLRPQGTLSFTVSGKTEDEAFVSVGATSFTSTTTVAGWGEAGWGGSPDLAIPVIFGWSNFSVVPVAYGDAQTQVTIEVDEELQNWSWELDTSGSGVDYALSDVVIRYVTIGVKDLT